MLSADFHVSPLDPISHALLGRSLNCLDTRARLGRGAAAAFVLGALAPDIDGALVVGGWDVYLYYHPFATHALIASPLLAAAAAGLVRLLLRGSHYGRLFVAALIGLVVGHVLFDLVSGSAIQLFAPLSARAFGPHLLAMADASAIAVLVAGTALSLWRRAAGGILVAAGLGLLLVAKAASLHVARSVYDSAAADVAPTGRPEPVGGSLARWRFFDRSNGTARVWSVDAWQRRAAIEFVRDVRQDAIVERTKSLPAVRRFLTFAELPFARIEQIGAERRALWSDLKYCEKDRCDLSFGAVVDEQGMPLREIIQVGSFIRTRSLGREKVKGQR